MFRTQTKREVTRTNTFALWEKVKELNF